MVGHIRPARMDDVPALDALIPLSARELSRGWYSPEQIESAVRYVFGVDTQLVIDGTYYVCETGRTIVGCGGWSRRATLFGSDAHKADAADPALDPARDPARIRAFFVHPAWARRRIGAALMGACHEAARAAGFRRMELMATLPGEPLYRAFGYEARERVEYRLPDGVVLPIVRMARAL